MSSPLSKPDKGPVQKLLIHFHQRASHGHRIRILAEALASLIGTEFPASPAVRCLDIGCGDMQIAEMIGTLNRKTTWTCVDIHELPRELAGLERWQKYRTFDGTHLPFADKSFDVALLSDVLHHGGDDIHALLSEAGRVAAAVVVKDHFEYSPYSRTMLWLLDFFGNWGYGVKLPRRYFTRDSFRDVCAAAGLTPKKIDTGVELYAHVPLARHLFRNSWQFIALLKERSID